MVIDGGLGQSILSLDSITVSNFLKVLFLSLSLKWSTNLVWQILMATMITYSLTITSVKISLLMLYRRIFVIDEFRKTFLIVNVLCILWCFIIVIINIFQCFSISVAFETDLKFISQCINVQNFYWGIAEANFILDFIILSMFLYMISGLQLFKRQKVYLRVIFLFEKLYVFSWSLNTLTLILI